MALTTPILLSIPAFDATSQQIFTFTVSGGDQVVANRLIIRNATTFAKVYDQKVTQFTLSHTLPANTLTNGGYYQATITTYNAAGNASSESAPIQFYCYTAPTFAFNNLPDNNIVTNNSFNFSVTYNQAQLEALNTYTFTLYDAQGVEISSSGTLYVGAIASLPINVNYTFSGFSDNTVYYIQAFGSTVNNTAIQTTRQRITVRYGTPSLFSTIELTNNCDGGYINVASRFVQIGGKSNPSPAIYVDNNTAVDARTDGRYVLFDNGFSIDGDFTAALWGRGFVKNRPIITMSNKSNDDNIVVTYRVDFDDSTKVYADCMVTDGGVKYYIYTPSIAIPADTDKVQFWIRRIDGLYELKLENLGGS